MATYTHLAGHTSCSTAGVFTYKCITKGVARVYFFTEALAEFQHINCEFEKSRELHAMLGAETITEAVASVASMVATPLITAYHFYTQTKSSTYFSCFGHAFQLLYSSTSYSCQHWHCTMYQYPGDIFEFGS